MIFIDVDMSGPTRTIFNLKHPSWTASEKRTVKRSKASGGGLKLSTPHGDRRPQPLVKIFGIGPHFLNGQKGIV